MVSTVVMVTHAVQMVAVLVQMQTAVRMVPHAAPQAQLVALPSAMGHSQVILNQNLTLN